MIDRNVLTPAQAGLISDGNYQKAVGSPTNAGPSITFTEIIKNWPGGTLGFAEDAGVDTHLASSWRQRNLIPPHYWSRLTNRAAARGFVAVTLQVFADLEASRKGVSSI